MAYISLMLGIPRPARGTTVRLRWARHSREGALRDHAALTLAADSRKAGLRVPLPSDGSAPT